jgi:hypothetical protein
MGASENAQGYENKSQFFKKAGNATTLQNYQRTRGLTPYLDNR